jgi:hypothetical protein
MPAEDRPEGDERPSGFPTTSVHSQPMSEASRLISELRDLCESVQLAPGEAPGTDRLAALEPRVDRAPAPRPPTAAHVADELVRRLHRLPEIQARVAAQLHPATSLPRTDTARSATEVAAVRELRAAHGLLDNLGCPRSEDDRNLPVVERLRWLLDLLTSASRNGRVGTPPIIADITPATGVHLAPPDPPAA